MLAYGIVLPLLDTTLISRFGLLPRIKDLYLSRLSVMLLAISFAILAFAPKFDFVFIGRSTSIDRTWSWLPMGVSNMFLQVLQSTHSEQVSNRSRGPSSAPWSTRT